MLFTTSHTQTDTTREWGMRSQRSGASTIHTHLPTFTEGCSEMNVLSTAMTSSCSRIFLKSVKALPAVVCQKGTIERGWGGGGSDAIPHHTLHYTYTGHHPLSRKQALNHPLKNCRFNYHMKPHITTWSTDHEWMMGYFLSSEQGGQQGCCLGPQGHMLVRLWFTIFWYVCWQVMNMCPCALDCTTNTITVLSMRE